MNCKRKEWYVTTGCLLAWACASAPAAEIKIIHINIGQGDATLILGPADATGNRVSVLMDAGNIPMMGKDGGKIVGTVLEKNAVTALDFFIVSHYDADHIGGAVAGAEHEHGRSFILGPNNVPGASGDDDADGKPNWLDDDPADMIKPDPDELGKGDDIPVKTFVDRGDVPANSSIATKKYRALAGAMGVRKSLSTQADVNGFDISLGGGASMLCLAANGFVRQRAARVSQISTENERSLCFLLRFGKFDYLIGGDTIGRTHGAENAEVEKAIGEFLVAGGINVDVLHVNHHGANNASEEEFLTSAAPEIAVISVGNGNSHGHPHADSLARLVEAGVHTVYQTEWGTTPGAIEDTIRRRQAIFQGDIVITSDGASYEVSTSRRFSTDE